MKSSRTKHGPALLKTLVAYGTVSLILLLVPARWSGPVRATISVPLVLAEGVVLRALRPVERLAGRFRMMWHATGEIERLRERERLLRARLAAESEARYAAEQRLAQIGQLPAEWQLRSIVATISGYDVAPFRRSISIDKGSEAGIAVGAGVLSHGILAGRVESVGLGASRILLLSDPRLGAARNADARLRVPVRCSRTRVQGVLEWIGADQCAVKYVPVTADVRPGDLFVTSGADGMLPAGLLVGACVEASGESGAAYKWIVVRPAFDAQRMEHVAVLLPPPSREP